MRLTCVTLLLAILARGNNAIAVDTAGGKTPLDFIGTFDTFTDTQCSQGGRGITVSDDNSSGQLDQEVMSVKAHLPKSLVIWVQGGGWYPLVVRLGDENCHELIGPGRYWNLAG